MIRCVLLTVFITPCIYLVLSNVTIRVPGDVVAGRSFTLECRLIRPTNASASYLIWTHHFGLSTSIIYTSFECTSSIPVERSAPAGLSGGCLNVSGEEVYTLTIKNVTQATGRGKWRCQYGTGSDNLTLDVKVMVTRVTLTNPPDAVLAGDPRTFTCVTSASKPQACIRWYIRSSGNIREIDPPTDCNQDNSSVQTTTRTLTFTASAEDNGAELYCNASNSVTDPPVRSQVYTVDVHYGPMFTSCKLSYTFMENVAAELSCTIWANPEPRINWSRGPQPRMSVTDHRYTSVVRFNKISRTDSGVYTVTANNNVTRGVERTVNVTVYSTTACCSLAGPLAGGISGGIVLLGVALAGVVILRRRKRGNCSEGEKEAPPNQQEMAENPSIAARAYQTLNLSPSSPEAPVYVNEVPIPEYENTSVITTENDSTDLAYERLRTNAAPIFDTSRSYENTKLS